MSISRTAAVSLVSVFAFATAASAHPALKSATPAVNGTVSSSLKELRLTFSETIVPAFSGVELTDQTGKPVGTGAPYPDSKNAKQLVVPITTKLTGGKYQLAWHAVGDDTHKTQGRFAFNVKR